MIPVCVGSAVEVRQISVSPKNIKASLSNCRPADVTVKLNATLSKLQFGGLYSPVVSSQYRVMHADKMDFAIVDAHMGLGELAYERLPV